MRGRSFSRMTKFKTRPSPALSDIIPKPEASPLLASRLAKDESEDAVGRRNGQPGTLRGTWAEGETMTGICLKKGEQAFQPLLWSKLKDKVQFYIIVT